MVDVTAPVIVAIADENSETGAASKGITYPDESMSELNDVLSVSLKKASEAATEVVTMFDRSPKAPVDATALVMLEIEGLLIAAVADV